jgi:hypothetical protein
VFVDDLDRLHAALDGDQLTPASPGYGAARLDSGDGR